MSKEDNNGSMAEDKLAVMRAKTSQRAGIELEEGSKNIYDVVAPVIGIGLKDFAKSNWEDGDIYSVIERTQLAPQEMSMFSRLIQRAEHGLAAGGTLDFPMAFVGERVVTELRARRSLWGDSSQRFENIMTTWLARLKAEEDHRLEQQSKKMVGS